MNPAIEWLFGIVASLSGRQASHTCTFVLYAACFTSNHFNYPLAAGLSITPSWR